MAKAKGVKFGPSPNRGIKTGGTAPRNPMMATQTAGAYKFPGMPAPRGQGMVPGGKGKGKGPAMPARGMKKSPVAF